ncbi:MAG: hypothetical protein AAFW89_06335 [Bacteroidota bacterium]
MKWVKVSVNDVMQMYRLSQGCQQDLFPVYADSFCLTIAQFSVETEPDN